MKLINLIKKTMLSLHQSIKRFPATLILTSCAAITLIVQVEASKHGNNDLRETLSKIVMVLALGVPLSLIIKFIQERFQNLRLLTKILMYLLSASFLIIYYFFLIKEINMVSTTRYIALNLAFYLAALITPFFYRKNKLELYSIKLFTRMFVTILFAGVLQLGISAILFTIDKLLGVYIYDNLYLYVWFLIAGMFIPGYFLSGIPQKDEELYVSDYSKVLKVLLLYIVMPLLSIYTLILYIYFAKITVTLQWPKGLVSNLVLWYSAITAVVIFFIWPLINETNWVKNFFTYITKLILPLIIILFMAIGIRIKEYGITENRYFVVALGIWVLSVMLYWNFSKIRRNIILPLTLAVVALISVTGPWSAYSISISSQNKRFEKILAKNNMLKGNEIIKPSSNISDRDKKEISAILSYFERYHSFKDMKFVPEDFKIQDMKSRFGFEFMEPAYPNEMYNYFSYMLSNLNSPIDIKGYDYLFSFRYPGNMQSQSSERLKAEYSYESHILRIYLDGNKVFEKDLTEYAKEIHNKYGYAEKMGASLSEMTFTSENEKASLKFIIIAAHGSKDTNSKDNIRINSIEFDLLVKIK